MDREAWYAVIHGVAKTEWLNWTEWGSNIIMWWNTWKSCCFFFSLWLHQISLWQAVSFSYSKWDLVPWSGIEPGLPACEHGFSATGSPGSPLCCFGRVKWNTNTQVTKKSVLFSTESDLLCSIIEMVILVKPKEYGTFMEENFKLKEFFPLTLFYYDFVWQRLLVD